MVDVQPPYFNGRLHHADIVIDHHPGYTAGNAAFEDVRIRYGATSTILTEYLISAQERVSERLATALLYGIKSDTLMLSRRVTDDDLQAFTFLYKLANYNLLRRIERPELPLSFAKILARAMQRFSVRDELAVVHLGPVKRDDLIVQMADFCLQFHGAEWVAVSGKLGDNLVIAVRNHGAGRSAGDVVRKLFGDIGSAGGHRNMAKAVIPLTGWRRARAAPPTKPSNRVCASCSRSTSSRSKMTPHPMTDQAHDLLGSRTACTVFKCGQMIEC